MSDDLDADGDGFESVQFGGTDCHDGNANIFPGAGEIWYDGVDQNCDGWSDFDSDEDGLIPPLVGKTVTIPMR